MNFADCAQGLNDVGYTVLDEVPEPVAKTTASAARNAAHRAGPLKTRQFPPQQ